MTAVTDSERKVNYSFFLVLLYLVFNIFFSMFSPDWATKLEPILIEAEAAALDPQKVEDVKPKAASKFIKVGGIEVRTSVEMDVRQLKNLCDRQSSTKVNFATKSSKGDNVLLKYDKVFQCQGISLRINGSEDFSALLQTSADGIIFSTIKVLKPGANDISLKNEKVQAVRVVVYNDTEKPWSLGDISCR